MGTGFPKKIAARLSEQLQFITTRDTRENAS
jgi:hypothetical protein